MADESMDLGQVRSKLTQEAYGDKADAVKEIRNDIAKSIFEARKQQLKSLESVYEKRRSITDGIPKFWSTTLSRTGVSENIEQPDQEALDHLTDISVKYTTDDPREFDVVFTFSSENPFFSETTLTKSFKIDSSIKKELEYELEAPTTTSPVKISWKDDKHNLVKKSPQPDMTKFEEYDEFQSSGSFFNFFTEKEDQFNLGRALEQIYQNALDIYSGVENLSDDSDVDDDDEEEDDEEDPTAEIDLGDSEDDLPKKKKQKKA